MITQADIENLIRAKGSIYSAAKVLVDKMGMAFENIEKLYIGGGFGNYLNVERAVLRRWRLWLRGWRSGRWGG